MKMRRLVQVSVLNIRLCYCVDLILAAKISSQTDLVERCFLQCLWASLHHSMQGLQRDEHPVNVALAKVEPGGFLQSFVPQLMPQDGDPDEFLTDLANSSGDTMTTGHRVPIHGENWSQGQQTSGHLGTVAA